MKVLVCGSEGSLGQAVISHLLTDGHTVSGADNLTRYGHRLGLAGNSYVFHNVNLIDRDAVDALVKAVKPDYIFQFAAQIYGVGGFNTIPASILGEDLTLHNNVLRAAVQNDVRRVIYSSSSMVYEKCPQDPEWPVAEYLVDSYPIPATDYGLSKYVGERLSRAFKKEFDLDYTIWRPFNIITPFEKAGDHAIGSSHVFADYIDNIVIKKMNPLPIIGSGDQIRCFTWIDDVAGAIAKYSFDDVTRNETFNLGNVEPITMKTLATKIKDIAAKEFKLFPDYEMEFKTVGSYPNDVRVRIPDMNKTKVGLKWEAHTKIDDSIRLCIDHAIEG